MTILLDPAIEARLRERAAREKQDADAMANALLAEALLRGDAEKEEALKKALLAAGIIRWIAPLRDPATADRPLIEVPGKPVSETLIEERR